MGFIIWFLVTALCGYFAYRAIRGGFERPQSERLNGYGYLGCIVLVLLAAAVIQALFP